MSPPSNVVGGPVWAALCARAALRPRGPALSLQRQGLQVTLSWSELALRVHRAATGWSRLGVGAGTAIVALGPLSESFVVSLLATQTLGATLRPVGLTTPDRALDMATHLLAHGGSDVDRVLARRAQRASIAGGEGPTAAPSMLKALVVEEVFGAETAEGVSLQSWSALLDAASGEIADTSAPAPAMPLQPMPQLPPHGVSGNARCVLAEFETDWIPGVDWLLNDWLAGGARLLLAEPDVSAGADLSKRRPQTWLASPQRVAAFDAQVRARVPSGGPAGWLAALAFSDHRGAAAALARWRLRKVLDLGGLRRLLTNAEDDAPGIAWLRRLGVTVERGLQRRTRSMTAPLPPATPETDGHPSAVALRGAARPASPNVALRAAHGGGAPGHPVVGLAQGGSGAMP